MLSYRDLATGGGVNMLDYIMSFLVSVVAGVISHYISKWLDDGNNMGNQ
jgi:hypothetical protein